MSVLSKLSKEAGSFLNAGLCEVKEGAATESPAKKEIRALAATIGALIRGDRITYTEQHSNAQMYSLLEKLGIPTKTHIKKNIIFTQLPEGFFTKKPPIPEDVFEHLYGKKSIISYFRADEVPTILRYAKVLIGDDLSSFVRYVQDYKRDTDNPLHPRTIAALDAAA